MRILFRKRLLSFLLLVSFVQVYGFSFSQKVTIIGEDLHVEDVFKQIEKQSDISFLYRVKDVEHLPKKSFNLKDVTIKSVLDRLFGDYDFQIEYTDDNYIIINKPVRQSREIIEKNKNATNNVQQDVKGKVVDKDSGQPLVGASVFIKGTSKGTLTNDQGEFELPDVEIGTVLLFAYTGFQRQEVKVVSHSFLNIQLESDVGNIDEVVITGYQTIDKRTFTGSVGKVEPENLATAGFSDVGKSLQGMVAGVAVENTSGTFGTKSKIRIRGNSSISGNQEPLWVIDGVVLDDPVNVNPNQLYSGDAATMLSSAISGINPDDIEDIQILKDASATAMYGTQAVNGVIVVTTKKGRVGETSISYKNNFTLGIKPTIQSFNVMNSKERMEFSEELYDKNLVDFTNMNQTYGAFGKLQHELSRKNITWNEYYDEIQRVKTYNTDWFDVLFRNSVNHEHSASLSTGNEKSQFYMSASYYRDNGQTVNQNTDRFSGNFKGNFNISDNFSITGTLYGSVRNQRLFGAFDESESGGLPQRDYDINPYTYARTTSRAMRPYDDEGNLEYYRYNYAPFNIIHEMNNNFVDVALKEIRFQIDGLWKITENLNLSTILSARTTAAQSEHIATELSNVALSYRAMESVAIRDANGKLYNDPNDDNQFKISVLPRGGIVMLDNNQGEFYTLRNSINYKPVFDDHSFDLMGGTEIRQRKYNKHGFTGYGLEYYRGLTASPDYRAIQRDQFAANSSPYYGMGLNIHREASFFANLAYSYKNRYNLTLSSRADGSNRLGTSERFRFLPIWVVGASWNIDDEQFLQHTDWLDYLKLRGSYGTRGNISGLGSPELLAYFGTTTRFNSDNIEEIINITAPDNPFMQWEKEKMANVALELGILNRVSLSLEWYHRNNFDLIGNVQVSRVSGFNTRTMNWADMKNEGFEVTLNTQNIKTDNFTWSTLLTFGYNSNKVTRLQTNSAVVRQTVDRGAPLEGRPVTGLYSFKFATLDGDGLPLFYTANGNLSNSFSRYSTNLDMLNYEGSREPLGSGGITNQFRYKGLEASFLFTYAYGNKVRLNPFFSKYYSDVMALDAELANRWTTPGDEEYTNIPRIVEAETRTKLVSANAEPFMAYNRSDIRVASGSYIRLKNIMVAYEIPKEYTQKARINSLKVTAQAQNIALWADPKLRGQDPEAIVSGVSIPAATSYTLGLMMNF